MANPKKVDLSKKLDDFLEVNNQEECTGEDCLIKDRSLTERVNKKFITEDGRVLLF